MWKCLLDFQFGPGRPAAYVLDLKPSELTDEDAVNAFCPYLNDGAWYRLYLFGALVFHMHPRRQADLYKSNGNARLVTATDLYSTAISSFALCKD